MYSVFAYLLERDGISVAAFSRATGISQSTLANWKKRNSMLSGKYAKIIANYFGVSVDFLMTGRHKDSGDVDAIASVILDREPLFRLFSLACKATDRNIELVIEFLDAIEYKERQIARFDALAKGAE